MKKRKKLPNTQRQTHKPKGLQIALIFGIVVALLVGLALLIKIGILISKSQFDGQHQFVIQVNEPTQTVAIIFSPDTHKIAVISLTGNSVNTSLTRSMQLPVDATVVNEETNSSSEELIHHVLVAGWGHSNLNQLDKLKLLVYSQTVASEDVTTKQLSLQSAQSVRDALVTSLATDLTLYKQAQTIAIINGSGISGVGNTIAKLLTHVGANVISVTTADTDENTSSLVYTGDKTYTVKRLSHIFTIVPVSTVNKSIADITIIIGKDKGEIFESL